MLQCMFIGGMLFLGTDNVPKAMVNLNQSTTIIIDDDSVLRVYFDYRQTTTLGLDESYSGKSIPEILTECKKDAEE